MGRTQKVKVSRISSVSSLTPQPEEVPKRPNDELRRSEPPPKRKKLAQELDEELSESEFDAQLDEMRAEEKQLKRNKVAKLKSSEDDDGSEGEDDEEDSEDADSDDEDADSDDEDDDDDDNSDDTNEETEDEEDDSDDEGGDDVEGDESDDEDTDLDDNEDEESDGVNGNSHVDGEDEGATKAVAKSRGKKAKPGSKKKKKKEKTEENIPIEATEMAQDLIARASRDKRTLFLKNLPQSATPEKIRSLSSDVLEVRIKSCKAKQSRNSNCAFVEFSDERTAIKNRAMFEHKKIDDNEISVDFVGEKSTFRPKKPQFPTSVDPRKLYISGLGKESTVEDLRKLFPTASSIDFPLYKKEQHSKGYAFIHFADEKACKDVHGTMQNQKFSGRVLTVMYAKKSVPPESKDSRKNKQTSRLSRRNKKTASESIEKKDIGNESDSDISGGENTADTSGNESN